MYELIASQTLGLNELIKKSSKQGEPDLYRRTNVSPGELFAVETAEEAESLVRNGLASRPPVEVAPLAPAPDDLMKKTVAELRRLAAERRVDLPRDANRKDEIVALLRKAEAAAKSDDEKKLV